MSNYRHSTSFSALKGLKETLQGNLSTVQYMRVLDAYLIHALEPLITKTSFVDGYVVRALAWSTKRSRRRLSLDRNVDFMKLSFLFILDERANKKVELWRKMKLERSLALFIAEDFIEKMRKVYIPAANCELPLPENFYGDPIAYYRMRQKEVESALRCQGNLLEIYHTVVYWYEKAKEFKHTILEKYVRMCLMSAQRDYRNFFNCEIELDDILQSYLFMASRAIDRCDANQGALTSHIQNWFLTARSALNKQRLNNEASLDEDMISAELEEPPRYTTEEDRRHLLSVASFADPEGLGRYLLGFEETLPLDSPRLFITKAMSTAR